MAYKYEHKPKRVISFNATHIAILVVIGILTVLLALPGKDERPVEVRLQEYLMTKVPRNATVAIEGLDDATLAKIERPIVWLANYTPSEEAIPLNVTIRGSHKMWVYLAEGEDLELNLSKQDLNWYNGTDVLRIEVYNPDLELIYTGEIEDDGDNSTSKKMGPVQGLSVVVDNDGEGAYKILLIPVTTGNDFYIKLISTKQRKLVIENQMFLIGNNSIWFSCSENCNISFFTSHFQSLRKLTITNGIESYEINIKEKGQWYNINIVSDSIFQIKDTNKLNHSQVDYLLKSKDTYFALSRDELFIPTSIKFIFNETIKVPNVHIIKN